MVHVQGPTTSKNKPMAGASSLLCTAAKQANTPLQSLALGFLATDDEGAEDDVGSQWD